MDREYEILGHTRSLSPVSGKEIDATILREQEGVYLIKGDENGKVYKTLIEKDYEIYNLLADKKIERQISPDHLHVYVSARCNLSCAVCYEKELQEISLKELATLLDKHKRIPY